MGVDDNFLFWLSLLDKFHKLMNFCIGLNVLYSLIKSIKSWQL